jgi:hypothetical protein
MQDILQYQWSYLQLVMIELHWKYGLVNANNFHITGSCVNSAVSGEAGAISSIVSGAHDDHPVIATALRCCFLLLLYCFLPTLELASAVLPLAQASPSRRVYSLYLR